MAIPIYIYITPWIFFQICCYNFGQNGWGRNNHIAVCRRISLFILGMQGSWFVLKEVSEPLFLHSYSVINTLHHCIFKNDFYPRLQWHIFLSYKLSTYIQLTKNVHYLSFLSSRTDHENVCVHICPLLHRL